MSVLLLKILCLPMAWEQHLTFWFQNFHVTWTPLIFLSDLPLSFSIVLSPCWSDFSSSSLTNWFPLRAFVLALPSAWNDFTRLIVTSSIFPSDFSLNVNNLERSIKYKLGIWFLSHHSTLPFYIASFLLSDIDHAIVFLTVFLLLDCKFESGTIISHVHCYTFSTWNHSWHSKCLLSLLVKSGHSFILVQVPKGCSYVRKMASYSSPWSNWTFQKVKMGSRVINKDHDFGDF